MSPWHPHMSLHLGECGLCPVLGLHGLPSPWEKFLTPLYPLARWDLEVLPSPPPYHQHSCWPRLILECIPLCGQGTTLITARQGRKQTSVFLSVYFPRDIIVRSQSNLIHIKFTRAHTLLIYTSYITLCFYSLNFTLYSASLWCTQCTLLYHSSASSALCSTFLMQSLDLLLFCRLPICPQTKLLPLLQALRLTNYLYWSWNYLRWINANFVI